MEAKVTLTIQELDRLRSERDEYKKKAEHLEKSQMKVKIALVKHPDHWFRHPEHFGTTETLETRYNHAFQRMEVVPSGNTIAKIEMVNVGELKSALHEVEKEKVADQIKKLENEIKQLRSLAIEKERQYQKSLTELNKKHLTEIKEFKEIIEKHENTIKSLPIMVADQNKNLLSKIEKLENCINGYNRESGIYRMLNKVDVSIYR